MTGATSSDLSLPLRISIRATATEFAQDMLRIAERPAVEIVVVHDASATSIRKAEACAALLALAPAMLDLLRDALAAWSDQFDGDDDTDLHVSGADFVDWFTGWRNTAKCRLSSLLPNQASGSAGADAPRADKAGRQEMLPLSDNQGIALTTLLERGLMDTCSNRSANLYQQILDKLTRVSGNRPVRQFLDVGTVHLSRADRAFLDSPAELAAPGGIAAMKSPDGWFVYVHDDRAVVEMSDALWAIFEKAHELGCDYVLFDADGPEHSDLERFTDLIIGPTSGGGL